MTCLIDITGQRFGRLTVIEKNTERQGEGKYKRKMVMQMRLWKYYSRIRNNPSKRRIKKLRLLSFRIFEEKNDKA